MRDGRKQTRGRVYGKRVREIRNQELNEVGSPTQGANRVGQTPSQTNDPSNVSVWTGRIISVLPAFLLLFSGAMKLAKPPEVIEGFGKLGWPEEYALGLGILEIVCTLLYLIPWTSVLGAILLTGYLGGAIATHVRLGDFAIVVQVILGVCLWLGLYLRDKRLRALLPVWS